MATQTREIAPVQKKFEPTVAQLVFAEKYIESVGNISKACKAIGCNCRNVYYRKGGWHYDKDFQAWLQEYARSRVVQHYGDWLLWCEKFAKQGSYRHIELLLRIAGKFSPREINIQNAVINQVKDGNIIVNDSTKEFLRAIAAATGSHIRDVAKIER